MPPDSNGTKKLGIIPLAAIVVSAMAGGGIFSLPQNMALGASQGAVILAWIITGVGVYFIANTFRTLAEAKPDATTGIYAYARLGFGPFAGFQIAWAYWLCNIFGNVGYAVLLMDALNFFFPGVFAGGNNLWSILGGSVVIWGMNYTVLRGVREAAFLNAVGTLFKLVPLGLFIVVMIAVFRWSYFTTDMLGTETITADDITPLGSMFKQIKSTMLVTLWSFIGIEGAVVVSGKARNPKDVGKATLLGFLGCLILFVLLSVLPFGKMYQPELAKLANPSTAPLLEDVVGVWGGWVMNLGVIVAILTSWLAFTIMVAQIPFAAAMDGTFPKIFQKENAQGTPTVSLWVTSTLMQIIMILVYFASDAWETMLSVTTVMIIPPYLACTLYLWKLCATQQYPENLPVKKRFAAFCGIAGSLYGLWMIYAAGISYLFMATCFLALGIPLYVRVRKTTEHRVFAKGELIAATALVCVALGAILAMLTGKIQL